MKCLEFNTAYDQSCVLYVWHICFRDGSVEVSDSLKEKSKYYQGKRKRKQQTVANDIKKVAAS